MVRTQISPSNLHSSLQSPRLPSSARVSELPPGRPGAIAPARHAAPPSLLLGCVSFPGLERDAAWEADTGFAASPREGAKGGFTAAAGARNSKPGSRFPPGTPLPPLPPGSCARCPGNGPRRRRQPLRRYGPRGGGERVVGRAGPHSRAGGDGAEEKGRGDAVWLRGGL